MQPILEIKDLHASIANKQILKGVNLTIKGGEIHAIMGPNGTGKSTLASVIMGQPDYTVDSGMIVLNQQNVLAMTVDERARAGIFLAMQYPAAIPGVTNSDFLRTCMNVKHEDNPIGIFPFRAKLKKAVEDLEMNQDLPTRYLNEGFSGGEMKRNEILQMKLLEPSIVILDEIDSGLDIDALRIVGENIMQMAKERGKEVAILMITHYQRLLNSVPPHFVHVLMNGKIVKSGDRSLALKLEDEGYEWLREEVTAEDYAEEN